MKLTILTWYWLQERGRAAYAAENVNIWADMVRRHIDADHEIACVTDVPEGIDPSIRIIAPPNEFIDVRIPSWPAPRPQCFRRLAMFRPDAADLFGERIVCMDLDCIVAGPLDPLFGDDDFRIFRGTTPKRPYNGSMMMIRAGARPQVYTEFTAERAAKAGKEFLGSDQAWISHILGWGERTWGAEDGATWWSRGGPQKLDGCRVMFFPGHPKPWDVMSHPWVVQHYRRSDEWDAAETRYRRRTA